MPASAASGAAEIETGGSGTSGGTDPLVNRFPTIAFSYDTDASRLVMLYRDPANGKTVSQIPTESALKQYKEAQQKEKDAERASLLKLSIGGGGQGGGSGAGPGTGQGGTGSAGSGLGGSGLGGSDGATASAAAGRGGRTTTVPGPVSAPSAPVPSATIPSVVQSFSSGAVNTARVNVVI
ncbi:hypothetical protein [Azospirillum sp. B510]|uniref:hypothetical protein n=1 Tax=Azospirillum sp. (strain B510) TaxID=137722 RepID=UPI00068B6EF9|nr:hypothetical protein [Azospirillum sp. B510]